MVSHDSSNVTILLTEPMRIRRLLFLMDDTVTMFTDETDGPLNEMQGLTNDFGGIYQSMKFTITDQCIMRNIYSIHNSLQGTHCISLYSICDKKILHK